MSDEQHARQFAEFLIEQPRAHGELTEGLHELIAAVVETGKSGTITLSVKVEPDKKIAGTLRISDNVKIALPSHDRPQRIYYQDKNGNLSRQDPNQAELPGLRDVSAPTEPTTLKEVN